MASYTLKDFQEFDSIEAVRSEYPGMEVNDRFDTLSPLLLVIWIRDGEDIYDLRAQIQGGKTLKWSSIDLDVGDYEELDMILLDPESPNYGMIVEYMEDESEDEESEEDEEEVGIAPNGQRIGDLIVAIFDTPAFEESVRNVFDTKF